MVAESNFRSKWTIWIPGNCSQRMIFKEFEFLLLSTAFLKEFYPLPPPILLHCLPLGYLWRGLAWGPQQKMLLSVPFLFVFNLAWPNSLLPCGLQSTTSSLKSCHPHSVEELKLAGWGHQLPPKPVSKREVTLARWQRLQQLLHLALESLGH